MEFQSSTPRGLPIQLRHAEIRHSGSQSELHSNRFRDHGTSGILILHIQQIIGHMGKVLSRQVTPKSPILGIRGFTPKDGSTIR